MKTYRVLTRSFIGNAIREEGSEVTEADLKGAEPGKNLELIGEEAEEAGDPFDHDGDGKPGGSKPGSRRKADA